MSWLFSIFNPAGRYCAHEETDESASVAENCDSTLQEYLDTLNVTCQDEGEAAILKWTPDENTPDVVYYQVKQHKVLWKFSWLEPAQKPGS